MTIHNSLRKSLLWSLYLTYTRTKIPSDALAEQFYQFFTTLFQTRSLSFQKQNKKGRGLQKQILSILANRVKGKQKFGDKIFKG